MTRSLILAACGVDSTGCSRPYRLARKERRAAATHSADAHSDSGNFDPECECLDLTVDYEVSGLYSERNVPGYGGQAFFQGLGPVP